MATGGAILMIGSVWQWLTTAATWQGSDGIPQRLLEHLGYSVVSMLIALVIAVPLGLWIGHTGRGGFAVAGVANAFRAIPTFGLLIAAVIVLGAVFTGRTDLGYLVPTILVLVLLAVPPILAGTYSGVQGVDPEARDAAYGMGMTGRQVLFRVEAPCALPLLMSGIRSAMLQVVSTATLAAYVSLGGLGRFIFDGKASNQYQIMLGGAVLVAALAIVAELVLASVQRIVVSPGLRAQARRD